MNAIIREAAAEDVDAVFALTQLFATSFVVAREAFSESFFALLNDESAFLANAHFDGSIAGYVLAFQHHTLYANGPVAWVEEITVVREHRRRGIGRQLMHAAEQWAAASDCRLVALATRRASRFYEALGYEDSATYFRKGL